MPATPLQREHRRRPIIETCGAVGIPDSKGKAKPLAEKTIRGHLEAIDLYFGLYGTGPDQWEPRRVVSLLARRKIKSGKATSQNTKRSRWKGLWAFDRFLRHAGYRVSSFLEGVPCPPAAPGRKAPTYDDEDKRLLLSCCLDWTWVGLRDQALIETFWRTGFRKSEFAAMRRVDVDFRGDWISTPTSKNGESYGTTLFPEARRAIQRYIEACPHDDAQMLWLNVDGSPMTPDSLTKMLKRIHRRAQAKGFTKPLYAHAMRHNFGRWTVRCGLSTRETADALGQRSERAAIIYTREVTAEEGQRKLRRIAGLSA